MSRKKYLFYPSFLEALKQNSKGRSCCREIHWKAVCVVLGRHNATWIRVVEVGLKRRVKRDISKVVSTGFDAVMCSLAQPLTGNSTGLSCQSAQVPKSDSNTPVMPE